MNDHKRRLVRRLGIIHIRNFQNCSRRNIRPVHVRIQLLDQVRMRMRLFRDEFQNRFVIQRGLLRFGEPRFADRLQARQIVRRHDVIVNNGASSVSSGRVLVSSMAGFGQMLRALKGRDAPRASANRWPHQWNPVKSPAAPAPLALPTHPAPDAENPLATAGATTMGFGFGFSRRRPAALDGYRLMRGVFLADVRAATKASLTCRPTCQQQQHGKKIAATFAAAGRCFLQNRHGGNLPTSRLPTQVLNYRWHGKSSRSFEASPDSRSSISL